MIFCQSEVFSGGLRLCEAERKTGRKHVSVPSVRGIIPSRTLPQDLRGFARNSLRNARKEPSGIAGLRTERATRTGTVPQTGREKAVSAQPKKGLQPPRNTGGHLKRFLPAAPGQKGTTFSEEFIDDSPRQGGNSGNAQAYPAHEFRKPVLSGLPGIAPLPALSFRSAFRQTGCPHAPCFFRSVRLLVRRRAALPPPPVFCIVKTGPRRSRSVLSSPGNGAAFSSPTGKTCCCVPAFCGLSRRFPGKQFRQA